MNDAPILVTGFEPFGGQEVNASWEAVSGLPDAIAGHRVVKLRVPVTFGESGDIVSKAMGEQRPAVAVSVGEAGGRACVTPERVAVNLMDARIPDNAGSQPQGEKVRTDGPDALLSTLPLDAMVDASLKAGVPARVSNTAGLYVCNQLMYRVLLANRELNLGAAAGFVHVPYTPAESLARPDTPSMATGLATASLLAMLEAVIAATSKC